MILSSLIYVLALSSSGRVGQFPATPFRAFRLKSLSVHDCKCFAQIQQTIDIFNKAKKVAIFAAVPLLLTGCADKDEKQMVIPEPQVFVQTTAPESSAQPKEKPVQLWTDEELELMALTLAGECYDDKEQDKRLVCEVILSRVSDGRFGDSITEVITAPNQLDGYWTQSRPVSDNDYEVAADALEDWYANDCEALSEYLFFVAGDNRENVFRSEY